MPRVLIAEGGRLQVVGRGEEAEALFHEATGEGPSDADPVVSLAEKLVETGRTDTAITVLSDALLRDPDDERLISLMNRALETRYPDAP
jgi:predicted Zn-dependent protease